MAKHTKSYRIEFFYQKQPIVTSLAAAQVYQQYQFSINTSLAANPSLAAAQVYQQYQFSSNTSLAANPSLAAAHV